MRTNDVAYQKIWKICIKNPFMNCEYIYPTQQRKVAELVNHLKEKEIVKKVVIFGSSVTPLCNINSDVDIYVELEEDKKVIDIAFNFVFDYFTNFMIDDRLLNEINKKGVIVYERK